MDRFSDELQKIIDAAAREGDCGEAYRALIAVRKAWITANTPEENIRYPHLYDLVKRVALDNNIADLLIPAPDWNSVQGYLVDTLDHIAAALTETQKDAVATGERFQVELWLVNLYGGRGAQLHRFLNDAYEGDLRKFFFRDK